MLKKKKKYTIGILISSKLQVELDLEDLLIYTSANIKEPNPDIKLSHQPTFFGSKIFNYGLNWVITTQKNNDIRIWRNGETAGYHCYCGFIKAREQEL